MLLVRLAWLGRRAVEGAHLLVVEGERRLLVVGAHLLLLLEGVVFGGLQTAVKRLVLDIGEQVELLPVEWTPSGRANVLDAAAEGDCLALVLSRVDLLSTESAVVALAQFVLLARWLQVVRLELAVRLLAVAAELWASLRRETGSPGGLGPLVVVVFGALGGADSGRGGVRAEQ